MGFYTLCPNCDEPMGVPTIVDAIAGYRECPWCHHEFDVPPTDKRMIGDEIAERLAFDARITLDLVQERFRENPTANNAALYKSVARKYHEDEMIGKETYFAAVAEYTPYLPEDQK